MNHSPALVTILLLYARLEVLFSDSLHTGVLADESYGEFGTDVVFNDMDADQLDTCSPEALHQNVHQPLLAESKQGLLADPLFLSIPYPGPPYSILTKKC